MTTKKTAPKGQAKPYLPALLACPSSDPVLVPRAVLLALCERVYWPFAMSRFLVGSTKNESYAPEDDYLMELVKARSNQIDKAVTLAFIRAQSQRPDKGIRLPSLEAFVARLADLEGGTHGKP
jgi:hypothetical protein